MADNGNANSQVEGRSQAQTPAGANSQVEGQTALDQGAHHSQAEEETITPATEREIREARRENQALRKRVQEYEAASEAAKLAQMGELEKTQKMFSDLQEKYASLEAERQNWRLADEIARQAPAIGLIDPDTARVLLLTGGELETDDDGNYKNVGKLLEKLVAAKPYLVAANQPRSVISPTSGGATNPGRSAALAAQPPAAPSAKEIYQRHKQSGGLGNANLWKRNA